MPNVANWLGSSYVSFPIDSCHDLVTHTSSLQRYLWLTVLPTVDRNKFRICSGRRLLKTEWKLSGVAAVAVSAERADGLRVRLDGLRDKVETLGGRPSPPRPGPAIGNTTTIADKEKDKYNENKRFKDCG